MTGVGLKKNNMVVTIYTVCYNEELILPFFIEHYRNIFPNCRIVIYDNESTDNSVLIAESYNCEVIKFQTNNTISDSKYLEIKNNCWKNSTTDWNIVCDCDEICLITLEDLKIEDHVGTSIIRFSAYDMVNISDNPDDIEIKKLKNGSRNSIYDKDFLFKKSRITDINYFPGCHKSNPIGSPQYSNKQYKMLHYKYIGENYLINRHNIFKNRLSKENINFNWGTHYNDGENIIREYFKTLKLKSEKVI